MLKRTSLEIIVIIAVILIATGLRLNGILSQSFWYDEAYTGIMVNFDWETLNQQLLYDVHPPVYIYLLKLYSVVFPATDYSLRFFSAFWGVAIIPLAYLVGKRLNSSKNIKGQEVAPTTNAKINGLIFAMLITVNPFFVLYSQEARSYTLVSFLYLLLIYAYLLAKNSLYKFSLRWQIFAIISAILFLTHYISILGIFSLVLFDFINKPKDQPIIGHFFKKIILYLQIYLIPLLFLIPYAYLILQVQYQNAPVQWWIPYVGLEKIYESLYAFIFGVNVKSLGVPGYLSLPFFDARYQSIGFAIYTLLVILITRLLTNANQSVKEKTKLLLSVSIVPILLAIILQITGSKLYLERYLIAFAIGVIAIITYLLSKTRKPILIIILFIYCGVCISILLKQQEIKNSGIREIYEMVNAMPDNKSIVVFEDPIDFIVAKYYFGTNSVRLRISNIGKSNDNYKDWELITQNDTLNKYAELKGRQRIFVSKQNTRKDIWYVDQIKVGEYYVYSTTNIPKEFSQKK